MAIQLSSDIDFRDNESLHLLTRHTTETHMTCYPLDTDGPFTLVVEHARSRAEAPAEPPRKVCLRSNSSAAQPADSVASSSAAQRAAKIAADCCLRPVRSRVMGTSLETPLFDKLVEGLDAKNAVDFMQYIQKCCFHKDLCYKTKDGEHLNEAMPISAKMEELLQIALAKRQEIPGVAASRTHVATEAEMQELMKNWIDDVESWMHRNTQDKYNTLLEHREMQRAHNLKRSRFTTFCHHISGCRLLLSKLIQLPIIQVHGEEVDIDANAIAQLLNDFLEHKKTNAYYVVWKEMLPGRMSGRMSGGMSEGGCAGDERRLC